MSYPPSGAAPPSPTAASSSSPVSAAVSQCRRLSLAAHSHLRDLEQSPPGAADPGLQSQATTNLNALARAVQELEALAAGCVLGVAQERQVRAIVDDFRHLEESIGKYASAAMRRMAEEQERAELFQRRGDMPSIVVDKEYNERAQASLKRSNHFMDDLHDMGSAVLGSLHDQNRTLKAAQRKTLDFMTTLGVSSSVIRVIERRQYVDKLIVFGGMLFTIFILALVVKYFRSF